MNAVSNITNQESGAGSAPVLQLVESGTKPKNPYPRLQGPTEYKRAKYLFFVALSILFILLAFLFNSPLEILQVSVAILTSPANLLTDYIQLSNLGATLLNVGVMTLLSLGLIKLSKAAFTGVVIAAVFTMLGFSFFGKNLYNTIPIVLGVLFYAKATKQPFSGVLLHAMFGTALSPLVSELSFNMGLPLYVSIPLSFAAGMLAGMLIVPLAIHFVRFHQGYSLYNIGFTAGIIGMLFTAVLSGFGVQIKTVSILSSGNNAAFSILLYSLFTIMLLLGFWINRWTMNGFGRLLALPGTLPSDFTTMTGFGAVVINMALLGLICVTYVLALGGELNGPVMGGIFTVVGFGAYGKHIKNIVPVFIGVLLTNLLNVHQSSATFAIIAALFGTTLAPIAGKYGFVAGILAGFLHMSLVTNVGFLHAGMNLYNNGFSGGFVAAFLVPFLDALPQFRRGKRR